MTKFSTNDVPFESKYTVHGSISYFLDNRILSVIAEGPFNLEILNSIAKIETEVIQQLMASGKWGEIISFKTNAQTSKDLLDQLSQYLKKRYDGSNNQPTLAIVMDKNIEGASIMTPLYLTCFNNAGLNCLVFNNYPEALKWVESVL